MVNTWNIPRGISFRDIVPSGNNTDTVTNSEWLPLGTHDNWLIVLSYAAGTIPPVIALQQATDSAGTGVVALGITDVQTISAVNPNIAVEAEVTDYKATINRSTPLASFDTTARGGVTSAKYRVVLRVDAQTLTTGNTHVRVTSTGTATARVFHAEAIGVNKAYRGTV